MLKRSNKSSRRSWFHKVCTISHNILRLFKNATFHVDCFLYWVNLMLFPIQYFILSRDKQKLTIKLCSDCLFWRYHTFVIFNKTCIASGHLNQYENSDSWWPDVVSIGKTQNVSEIIVYNLYQQKRFFVDVTLKSSMVHYRLMTLGYFCDIFVFTRHPNSYLVA